VPLCVKQGIAFFLYFVQSTAYFSHALRRVIEGPLSVVREFCYTLYLKTTSGSGHLQIKEPGCLFGPAGSLMGIHASLTQDSDTSLPMIKHKPLDQRTLARFGLDLDPQIRVIQVV
jgi:hypothetical protein